MTLFKQSEEFLNGISTKWIDHRRIFTHGKQIKKEILNLQYWNNRLN